MKAELQKRKQAEELYRRLHPMKRTIKPPVERKVLMLPEEFTGRDLKKAKKLMRRHGKH